MILFTVAKSEICFISRCQLKIAVAYRILTKKSKRMWKIKLVLVYQLIASTLDGAGCLVFSQQVILGRTFLFSFVLRTFYSFTEFLRLHGPFFKLACRCPANDLFYSSFSGKLYPIRVHVPCSMQNIHLLLVAEVNKWCVYVSTHNPGL